MERTFSRFSSPTQLHAIWPATSSSASKPSGLRVVGLASDASDAAHEAELFYAVHKERPFYKSLCDYMSSGPVIDSGIGRGRRD